jgi:hypothetical protein
MATVHNRQNTVRIKIPPTVAEATVFLPCSAMQLMVGHAGQITRRSRYCPSQYSVADFGYPDKEPTMKGTILDFLKLASEKPDLAEELVELATKHGFEFSDEVSDEELEAVAGGTVASMSIDSARDSYLNDMKKADPAVSSQTEFISRFMDSIKDLADIQKTTTGSTLLP